MKLKTPNLIFLFIFTFFLVFSPGISNAKSVGTKEFSLYEKIQNNDDLTYVRVCDDKGCWVYVYDGTKIVDVYWVDN